MGADEATAGRPTFSTWQVLSDGCHVLFRNFATLPPLAIAIQFGFWFLPANDYLESSPASASEWLSYAIEQLGQSIVVGLTGVIALFGPLQNLLGRSASLKDALRGLRFAPLAIAQAAIWYSIFSMLIVLRGVFAGHPNASFAAGLVVVGLSLAVLLAWWVAVPVLAIERLGLFAALRRSAQLTRGRRWSLLGIFVLCGIPFLALTLAINGLFFDDLSRGEMVQSFTLLDFADVIWAAFLTLFLAILSTVTYYHLRIEKEPTAAQEIARAVD